MTFAKSSVGRSTSRTGVFCESRFGFGPSSSMKCQCRLSATEIPAMHLSRTMHRAAMKLSNY